VILVDIIHQLSSILFVDIRKKMSREKTIQLCEDDLWIAYSLPGSQDFLFMIGEEVNHMSSETCFILQGWDQIRDPRIFVQPKSLSRNTAWTYTVHESCQLSSTPRADYEKIIQRTVDAIKSDAFEKAVISKIKVVHREEEDLFELYEALHQTYRTAFTFMYNIPGKGTWCGATPEVLITSDADCIRTMALAGTLPLDGRALSDIPWTSKERHEQGVIEDYVEEACKDLELDFHKEGPKTISAGSMAHLQSTYTISGLSEALGLIDRLHPGPAICGRPKTVAKDWIEKEEQHNREHYCGFLGPWGIEGEKGIYVHLRSMRIYKEHYVLYLGGGITADSDVAGEWDETELKAQTMLSVINSIIHG